MNSFPEGINFKYSWRKYQKRVLDELDQHLDNEHLHIIAPPGSGKTVLGLEVTLRLNKACLILAPTIAIRNQWIDRFCELFLQTSEIPDWISTDIRKPSFMTVVTYQGLHVAGKGTIGGEIAPSATKSKLDSVIDGLLGQDVKTIVADEAHHLKNEWWQTLNTVKERLEPVVIGLTATPPYDVSASEWHRYTEFNGPVDAEITIPELVDQGDLCPHQDYVFLTAPSETERQVLVQFRQEVADLFQELKQDPQLVKAIGNHPIWKNPTNHLEWIYSHPTYYSACLVFMNANDVEVSDTHLQVIGNKGRKLPHCDFEWLAIILEFYLYKETIHFNNHVQHKSEVEKKLKRCGAIEKRQINFTDSASISKLLTSSTTKLDAIEQIVGFEYSQLQSDTRLVILTDYIRKEYLVGSSKGGVALNKIGVVPIFEKLRRKNPHSIRLGILTGSLVILPRATLSAIEEKDTYKSIDAFAYSPLSGDENYVLVHQSSGAKGHLLKLVTQMFQEGEIEVLIGTKSLLGEGWDAPAINTLILASSIGSFVLSNQMRGRAIRTQRNNEDKTGNIWHLCCVDPTAPSGGRDYEIMKRRFRGFLGVSFKDSSGIENGIERLDLPQTFESDESIGHYNSRIMKLAADRAALKDKWSEALRAGVRLVEELKTPFREDKPYAATKALYYSKTIKNLVGTLGSGLLWFGLDSLSALGKSAKNIHSWEQFFAFLSILCVIGVILFGRQTLKSIRIFFKYRDIYKDIHGIGKALVESLLYTGVIKSDPSTLNVVTSHDDGGAVMCHLEGGTAYEKSLFISTLQEILSLVDNPRYIIVRKSTEHNFTKQDYHAVPEILGRNKESAESLKQNWKLFVGDCELVFTRTVEGRKLILKSRTDSLAKQLEDDVEHISVWR